MTNEQRSWLDYHQMMGSPYHLMIPVMKYELDLTEKQCEVVVREYVAERKPAAERSYRRFVIFELSVIWALALPVAIFAPTPLYIKVALIAVVAVMSFVRLA